MSSATKTRTTFQFNVTAAPVVNRSGQRFTPTRATVEFVDGKFATMTLTGGGTRAKFWADETTRMPAWAQELTDHDTARQRAEES